MSVLSLVGLAACSSGSPKADATDSSGAIHVTMELGTENLIMLPVLYARSANLFQKHGLDVTWQPTLVNAPALAQNVASKKVDFAFADLSGIVRGQAANLDLATPGSISIGASYQIVLSNKAIDKIKARGLDPATMTTMQKFQALKGLKIDASPGGINEALLTTGLTTNGVKTSQVTIAPNSDQSSVVVQLRQGQIDGFIFGPPTTLIPTTGKYGQIWIDFQKDVPGFDQMPIGTIYSTKAGAKSEAARRLLETIQDAVGQLRSKPSTVSSVVKKGWFANLDQSTYDASFQQMVPAFGHSFIPTDAGYEKSLSITTNPDGSHPKTPMSQVYEATLAKEIG